MAPVLQKQYKGDCCHEYVTRYSCTLPDWSLNHDSTNFKRGAASIAFKLAGTSYTCQFFLEFQLDLWDWTFIIEFSDTWGIEIMFLEVWVCSKKLSLQREYIKPIPERLMHRLQEISTYGNRNLFLNTSSELKVSIRITTILKKCGVHCLNPSGVTPMVFSPSNPAPPNIAAELKTMFEKKILSDVTFVLGDETFYAHKVVLAAQSTVFKAMFASSMKEQKNNIIEISDTNAEIFRQFLNYLYSGQVTELEKVVEEMILVADFYDVSHLKVMCENFMLESLSENSAIRYLILADKLQCDTFKNLVLHFIRNGARVLEKAILEEDTATMMWLKEQLSNNQPKEKAEPIVS